VRQPPRHSYGQIFDSSLLIGGSSLIALLAQLIRTKVVAVFLGPAGLGLMGLFISMTSLAGTVASMGIVTSGVCEIGGLSGSGDDRLARTVAVVRWLALRLGLLGSAILGAFCIPLSRVTFGTTDYAGHIALLSVVVAASVIADGQVALLQGLRRIADIAKVAILGTTASVALTLPILYFWRQDAVVPLLIAAAATGLAASWWYARRIETTPVAMTWRMALQESRPLFRLGLATMSAAVIAAAIAYAIRVMVARHLGVEAAGIYQAATTLSAVYCGFILSAMGTDLLPRLSSAATDDGCCNRLVNEQVEVGVLLALPGICGTLAFASLIIPVLYSEQFSLATDVLRWQVLGVLLRVASWPMGYFLLAKGEARMYFWTELSYNVVHAALVWACVQMWGLAGAGVAFFGLYLYYFGLMWVVTRRSSGFVWSPANRRVAMVATPLVALVFISSTFLPLSWAFVTASIFTILAALYSFRMLRSLTGGHRPLRTLDGYIQRIRAAGSRAAGFLQVNHG
jgi:antigen flippase